MIAAGDAPFTSIHGVGCGEEAKAAGWAPSAFDGWITSRASLMIYCREASRRRDISCRRDVGLADAFRHDRGGAISCSLTYATHRSRFLNGLS